MELRFGFVSKPIIIQSSPIADCRHIGEDFLFILFLCSKEQVYCYVLKSELSSNTYLSHFSEFYLFQ